ncbi:MAG: hypothetical protein A2Y07_01740 [Planctomycetes bacterium GWF2_50_10]|nr:MAG: hypothetical protein A2Y07_01740 [Planctomycetes bacterium GWF2_50_10]
MKIVADTNIPFVKECFSSIGEVTLYGGRQISAEAVRDADILLVRSVTNVNKELLEGSRLKFVATATIGTDHVEEKYLVEKGIGFSSAPGSNANSVAEYITAALLVVARKHGMRLAGKSIGVVGVGNVGSRVAKKARALGMEVLLNDPPLAQSTGDAKYLPMEKLYGCDFLTFHTPLTKAGQFASYHLADERFFGAIKPGAVFFNSSRGGVHDTAALKGAIKSGKLLATVLDVWENEPNIDAELLEMVDLASPHIAGYSYDGKVVGMMMIYEAACRFFGLEITRKIGEFLPAAIVPSIDLCNAQGTEQQILHETIRQIYDIEADDARCRAILKQPAGERGKYFDKLRKDYPIRREFQNTTLFIKDNAELARTFGGLGFEVDSE